MNAYVCDSVDVCIGAHTIVLSHQRKVDAKFSGKKKGGLDLALIVSDLQEQQADKNDCYEMDLVGHSNSLSSMAEYICAITQSLTFLPFTFKWKMLRLWNDFEQDYNYPDIAFKYYFVNIKILNIL